MSLKELNNTLTDKDTIHSYLETYQGLFEKKKYETINLLEVGIAYGGSIKLWRDYFVNGYIYGIDVNDPILIKDHSILNDNRVTLFSRTNAYDANFIENNLRNVEFDFVIDDGPHSLQSMIDFINLYSKKLKENGILIIEDVQEYYWLDILKNNTPDELKQYIKYVDIRHIKGRYDDIMFIIDKSQVQ
jgi:hypothetical protein